MYLQDSTAERNMQTMEMDNVTSSPIVAIAISGSKKSKHIVKWALDNFPSEKDVQFRLLHVYPSITTVPTPLGTSIPISQVREDVVTTFRKEVDWQTNEKILPFKLLFIKRKVHVDLVHIEADDIANAIAEEVLKCNITKLVIGVSSTSIFSRNHNWSSKMYECTPNFCSVYLVSKGKLSSMRSPDLEKDHKSIMSSPNHNMSSINPPSPTNRFQLISNIHSLLDKRKSPSETINIFQEDAKNSYNSSPSRPIQRFQASSMKNRSPFQKTTSFNRKIYPGEGEDDDTSRNTYSPFPSSPTVDLFRALSLKDPNTPLCRRAKSIDHRDMDDGVSTIGSIFTNQNNSYDSSFRSSVTDNYSISWATDRPSTSGAITEYSSGTQVNNNLDLEKLRMELKHMQGLYSIAQTEAIDASRKKRRLVDAIKLKEIKYKEEKAKGIAKKQEKEKFEADYAKECTENEETQRKEKTMSYVNQYQIFSWEEITSATESFSETHKIGIGSYGSVYKCSLRHTIAAVKILHSSSTLKTKQFLQELEILSKIRHPHLLTLLGACPERGCLIYEYMQNGSLEEKLFRSNNTIPLPWFERYRIALEVASALMFLHSSKPKVIVHRDLKPANILLDHNLVSKIGDVGLSTMVQLDYTTSPVGTLCYIDPEYQRTGIVSAKSDVYALGMVILQLLTAKPAIALAHIIEEAVKTNKINEVLDKEGGKWPIEETNELIMLALKCTEIRSKDRPDLENQILPILEKLRIVADNARDLASTQPPSHFICPLLKDVMNDPCVAADGYTYDRKAIEKWLQENDNSPLTNELLPHKHLLPNFTFLSAITEWKSSRH